MRLGFPEMDMSIKANVEKVVLILQKALQDFMFFCFLGGGRLLFQQERETVPELSYCWHEGLRQVCPPGRKPERLMIGFVWPRFAASWALPAVREMREVMLPVTCDFECCMYGLRNWDKNELRKPGRVASNSGIAWTL